MALSVKLADVMRDGNLYVCNPNNRQDSVTVVASIHAIADSEFGWLYGRPT